MEYIKKFTEIRKIDPFPAFVKELMEKEKE